MNIESELEKLSRLKASGKPVSGIPVPRPHETHRSYRKRVRIAQAVKKYGLKVHCEGCFAEGRFWGTVDLEPRPLRSAHCERCGTTGLMKQGWPSQLGQRSGRSQPE